MKNLNAVLFDMDGLLLDTEKIALSAFVEACRECRFEPDLGIYRQCVGTTYDRAAEILKTGYGKDFPYDAVQKLWDQKFLALTSHTPLPLKEGAMGLLRYLQREGTKRAVVTSTPQVHATRWLTNAGILGFFEFVLGGDQISKGKPDPEIYLVASQKLGEHPAVCLALEDSDNGVRSAINAGMRVVQVPDINEPSAEVKALGHTIVKSLVEVEHLLARL